MKIEFSPAVVKDLINKTQRRSERIKRTKQRDGTREKPHKLIVLVMDKSYLSVVETIKERTPQTMTVYYIAFFLAYLLATAQIDKAH